MSEVKGWEKVRVQVDTGAIDTVGPEEVAKAFATKEDVMSKKGLGYVAVNGSRITEERGRIHGSQRRVEHEDTLRGREEGTGIGPQDESGRERSGVGWQQELHAEQGDGAKDQESSTKEIKDMLKSSSGAWD